MNEEIEVRVKYRNHTKIIIYDAGTPLEIFYQKLQKIFKIQQHIILLYNGIEVGEERLIKEGREFVVEHPNMSEAINTVHPMNIASSSNRVSTTPINNMSINVRDPARSIPTNVSMAQVQNTILITHSLDYSVIAGKEFQNSDDILDELNEWANTLKFNMAKTGGLRTKASGSQYLIFI